MNTTEAIAVIDAILESNGLNDLEVKIFSQAWAGAKYPDIAESLGYDPNYVKDVGAKIWKQLTQSLGEKVTKSNVQTILRRHRSKIKIDPDTDLESNSKITELEQATPNGPLIQDWGEQASIPNIVGREQPIAHLSKWITDKSCRLVALVGMAGIGKTSLTSYLAHHNADDFEVIIWRSLKNLLPLNEFVDDLLQGLQVLLPEGAELDTKTHLLLAQLKTRRCLIILDNTETLVSVGSLTGAYRSGYEGYRDLFQQLGLVEHQSCVYLTCREQPKLWGDLKENGPVRILTLPPFSPNDTQKLLQSIHSFDSHPQDWKTLTEQYGGNPLALKIVSSSILDYFQGNVSEFLAEGQVVFEGLSAFLQLQWQLLSPGEQWVLNYLTIRREPVAFKEIKLDCLDSTLQRRLTEVLASLHRRSLLERHTIQKTTTFGLQTAVFEYASFRFSEALSIELAESKLNLIHQCPLLKLVSQDHIRKIQQQQLLQPILDQLTEQLPYPIKPLQHLEQLLAELQTYESSPSYAAGNLVNLLIQSGASLDHRDLSQLALWEVDLSLRQLHHVNLSNTDLSRTRFAYAFGGVTCVAFSPTEDRFISGHENGNIFVWETQHGRQIQRLSDHKNWIWEVCWSPNGDTIISASEDQTLRVWDADTGDCLRVLEGHRDRIWSVICPSQTIAISASSDRSIKIWDLLNGQCTQTLTGHDGDIFALAANEADQVIFSGGADHTIRCWDWTTGELLETWISEQGSIWSIVYQPSTQTVYSAGDHGVVEVWHRGYESPITTLNYPSRRIWSISMSPCDRYLVAGGDSNQLMRWDLHANKIDQSLGEYAGRISSVDYSSTGELVITASEDQSICLWNINQGQRLLQLQSYSNWACEVGIVPSQSQDNTAEQRNLVASAYGNSNLYLWNIANGNLETVLQGHQRSVWTLAINPVGSHLVSGSDEGTLRIWDLMSGQCQMVLKGHQSRVWTVAWSPTGKAIASGSGDQTVKLWNPNSGDCLFTFTEHQQRIWSVAFSPDGQWLASGSSDNTIKFWDVESGRCHATLRGHQSLITSIAFHPTHPILASVGGDGSIKFWNLDNFTCQDSIPIPVKMNWSLAWSPDGTQLAIGGNDGKIRLWNHQQKTWEQTISGQTGCIWSLAFSANGQILCSGSQDGTTCLWDMASYQCDFSLQPQRLYEGLNIMDASGLTMGQIDTLRMLGARS